MADPFEVSTTPQTDPSQGFGGISPDSWRNLMMLGANVATAANARNGQGFLTYGNGLAGPLGAGVQGTMEAAQKQAALRSQLGLQQQQIRTSQLQNKLTELQIPMAQQRLGFIQQLVTPDNAAPAAAGGTALANVTGDPGSYSNQVAGLEGGGKNPRSSSAGIGQFNIGTWNNFAQENPQYFSPGMDQAQILDMRDNSAVAHAAIDWLAKKNAPVLAQNGVQPSNGSLGLAHYLGPAVAARMWQADPGASAAAIIKTSLPPDQAQAYLDANPQLGTQTAGQVTKPYRAWDMRGGQANGTLAAPVLSAPSAAPAIPGPDPKLLSQASALFQKARLAAASGLPPGPWQAQAQALMEQAYAGAKAGTEAAARLPYQIHEVRPGGGLALGTTIVAGMPQPTDEILPSGARINVLRDPLTNRIVGSGSEAGQNAPVSGPGSVGMMPPGAVLKALPPQVTEARDEAVKAFMGKEKEAYTGAQMTLSWLEQMDHAQDVLNENGGFTGTGPTAQLRLHVLSLANDAARTLGIKEPIDPAKISSWEEFNKANTTAGFELASHYEGHSRQAATTIMNATSAVPGVTNSPQGGKLVLAGIREGAQANIDLHNYKQDVYNKTGDITSADTDFFRSNPAQLYARRAISNVIPYKVSGPEEFKRYLPGTYIITPSGKLTQVPMRDGAPSIPEYMQPAQQPVAP